MNTIMIVLLMLSGPLYFFMLLGVYADAYKRGANQYLSTLLTLCTAIVGAILYLLVRPDEKLPKDER
jgi:ABC-type tungstate transport system substrate-binding protein